MKATAFYRGDTVVIVLQDVMTKGERTLAEAGNNEAVLDIRDAFQETMGPDLVAAVEKLTGRSVEAFISGNSVEADIAAEVFVLDRPRTAPLAVTRAGLTPGWDPPAVPLAVLFPALPDLRDAQPGQEREHGHEVGDRRDPVAGVRDQEGHEFADDSSHSARLVKPTITASIQYCERTASLESS
jgi:uncharacterized protein YbcI